MANLSKYSTLPVHQANPDWNKLPLTKRNKAHERYAQISGILQSLEVNNNLSKVLILEGVDKKQYPSVRRWVEAYQTGGMLGLVPKHKGKSIKPQPWHGLASQLYLQTSKPGRASVAKKLLYGNEYRLSDKGVSEFQICNYLKTHFPENAPERIGKSNHRLNQQVYTRVGEPNILPGDEYQGDGHTIDLYLAHHNTGKTFRYEFTVWLDVASRYIVGWALSNAESSYTTLESLSSALITHNHTPLTLHIDNGAGFVNKMLNDPSTGFYIRLGVRIKKAHPGNSKGKGKVERWFKTFEMQLSQIIGTGYCGQGHDPKTKSNWHSAANKGKASIYTVDDFKQFLGNYLDQYHRTPHRGEGMNKRTPDQVWATRKQRDLDVPHDYFVWVQNTRIVQKGTIRINSREYVNNNLVPFNNKKVVVEYALNNDQFIKIFTLNGTKFITQADLVKRKLGLTQNLLKDINNEQKQAKLKRINKQAQEIEHQYIDVIDAQVETLQDIGMMNTLPHKKQPNLIDIDISQLSTG